jgi:hypothetical protein
MVLRVTWFAFDKGPQRSVPDAVKKTCRNQETSGFVFLHTHTKNSVRGKEKKQKRYIDSGRKIAFMAKIFRRKEHRDIFKSQNFFFC